MTYDIEVIFVQANPLDIYERALKRNRDENDKYEVVIGRCEASMRLKTLLHQYLDDFDVFISNEDFKIHKDHLIKMMKWRMK